MTKVILAVLVSLMLAAPARAVSPHHPGWRNDKCRYQTLEPGRWTHHEVILTLECATNRFGVPFYSAALIAARESNFDANAENPSGACGIFQHMPRYWPGRFSTFARLHPRLLPAKMNCFNARSNILVSVDMMARLGFGPWS